MTGASIKERDARTYLCFSKRTGTRLALSGIPTQRQTLPPALLAKRAGTVSRLMWRLSNARPDIIIPRGENPRQNNAPLFLRLPPKIPAVWEATAGL